MMGKTNAPSLKNAAKEADVLKKKVRPTITRLSVPYTLVAS